MAPQQNDADEGAERKQPQSPADGGATGRKRSSGAARPIVELSKLALKDAVLELETKVRGVSDLSSSAALQVWQSAEKRLGVEVGIEDPALRSMFDLHIVAVEELCNRVRAHAEATVSAADSWSKPQLQGLACELDLLCPVGGGGTKALGAELKDADVSTAAAFERVSSRIQSEVNGVIEVRFYKHEDLRAVIRERHRWDGVAAAARRDVARLRKGNASESGLAALSGSSPLETAEEKMQAAMQVMAKLDEQLLTGLLELGESSVEAVRRPWASLLQIQAEFYTAQQTIWTPLSAAFEEFSGDGASQAPETLA